jgi:hypothetical protein
MLLHCDAMLLHCDAMPCCCIVMPCQLAALQAAGVRISLEHAERLCALIKAWCDEFGNSNNSNSSGGAGAGGCSSTTNSSGTHNA